MAWNGAGTFNLNPAFSPELNGNIVDAVRYNGLTTDIATGITNTLAKDGQNVPTANLPMGGLKHLNAADATAPGEYLTFSQVPTGADFLDIVDPLLGANLMGYSYGIGYGADTVGEALDDLNDAIILITGTVDQVKVVESPVGLVTFSLYDHTIFPGTVEYNGGLTTAPAGKVGEVLTAGPTSDVLVSSGIATDIHSLTLTAGVWLVHGWVGHLPTNSSVEWEYTMGGISTTSGTLPNTEHRASQTGRGPAGGAIGVIMANVRVAMALPTRLLELPVDTTIYLVAQSYCTVGNFTVRGTITAVRIA